MTGTANVGRGGNVELTHSLEDDGMDYAAVTVKVPGVTEVRAVGTAGGAALSRLPPPSPFAPAALACLSLPSCSPGVQQVPLMFTAKNLHIKVGWKGRQRELCALICRLDTVWRIPS